MKKEYRLLIELYLQDSCTEEQLQEVLQLVQNDEEFKRELADAGRMQGLLYSYKKKDYDSVVNRVEKSIRDMDPDSLELEILDKIENGSSQLAKSKKWAFALWAAIAAQIFFVLFLTKPAQTDKFENTTLASLYSESGRARLIRNGKEHKVTADLRLVSGDKIIVEDKGDIRITWSDSTVTQFKDESEAIFSFKDGAKHIFIEKGKLLAQVTKQPDGRPLQISTPNSAAKVIGTKFIMKVNELESMLEVNRGAVELTKNSNSKAVVVRAHEYAVVSPGQPLIVSKSSSAVYRSHEINLDTKDRKVDIVAEINGSRKLYLVVYNGRDGIAFDHAGWLNPRLEDSLGRELPLIELQWKFADSEWGVMGVGIDALGEKLTHNEQYWQNGIGTHALSIIEYDIPEGYKMFKATGVITDSGSTQKRSLSSVVFEVYTEFPEQRYRRLMLHKKGK